MNTDERHEMREQHRAEILLPTGRAIYCENCCEPIKGEEANFNWHTKMVKSPITIQKTYCFDCIPEVIAYRHKMRNVAEMTTDIVARVNAQKAWEQECEKSNQVKHI